MEKQNNPCGETSTLNLKTGIGVYREKQVKEKKDRISWRRNDRLAKMIPHPENEVTENNNHRIV